MWPSPDCNQRDYLTGVANPHDLTHSQLLVKNSLWNFLDQSTLLLVALFAIPALIQGLGTDRFGVLTLTWMMIGYFSLFDPGFGRIFTHYG